MRDQSRYHSYFYSICKNNFIISLNHHSVRITLLISLNYFQLKVLCEGMVFITMVFIFYPPCPYINHPRELRCLYDAPLYRHEFVFGLFLCTSPMLDAGAVSGDAPEQHNSSTLEERRTPSLTPVSTYFTPTCLSPLKIPNRSSP